MLAEAMQMAAMMPKYLPAAMTSPLQPSNAPPPPPLRRLCSRTGEMHNTDYAFEILCTSLQNKQITFLNDLTDTMLDVYNLLSLPVHYGLDLSV